MIDFDLVMTELFHDFVLPVLQALLESVHIVVQLIDLLIELQHETFRHLDANLSHVHIKFPLILNPQLYLVLYFSFQLAHHLGELSIDLHCWLVHGGGGG